VDLIAEFSATQHAFFAETEKPRQVMRGFPLIQLAPHAPPVCFVIECLQNVGDPRKAGHFMTSMT
jgi:hypothetical protein